MIKSILRWILAFLAALVAVILVAPSMTAASPGAPGVAALTCDCHGTSALAVDTAAERGPPATCDRHTTYDAVGPAAHGALPRPTGRTTSPICSYDDTGTLAQIARGNAHSAGRPEVAADDSRVPQRSGVAANGVTWADKAELDLVLKIGDESVGVLGNVSRSGSVATIDDIAMFGMNGPLVGQVGPAAMRQAGANLLREAAPSGVNQVVFRGVRSVSSSGKPGHVVDLIASLTDDGSVVWRVSR